MIENNVICSKNFLTRTTAQAIGIHLVTMELYREVLDCKWNMFAPVTPVTPNDLTCCSGIFCSTSTFASKLCLAKTRAFVSKLLSLVALHPVAVA